MIEPLTPAVIVVATLVLKKAFEKTGEKLREAVTTQVSRSLISDQNPTLFALWKKS